MTKIGTDLNQAARELDAFRCGSTKARLSSLERRFCGKSSVSLPSLLESEQLTGSVILSALAIKDASSQINEIVHAVGILKALPLILEDGEEVQSLSLGAGNTGRSFDLETNRRVAEFKFTEWKGADAVRQDSLFRDFYELAEHETDKRKFMYVIGMDFALRFLRGGRACKSVLARHQKTWKHFASTYNQPMWTVAEYFALRGSLVTIVDLTSLYSELAGR